MARAALAGAVLGLGLFALESWRILDAGAIGIGVDLEGPFAALFAAVQPLLAPLLLRVAVAYAVGGAALGALAGGLTTTLRVRSRWVRRGAFLVELAGLWALLAWDRAIARPALFDDLAWLRPVLQRLVDAGEPWHPRAAFGVLVAVHLALALASRRGRVVAFTAAAVGVWLAAASLPKSSAASGPLIVLFGIDAFRPDRLSAHGGSGQVAPNLERFLADATRFERAYTPIAQTEPAWRSLLTARWPPATGVRYPLTPEGAWRDLPTFPRRFAEAGWRTSFQTDCARFHWQGESSGFAVRRQPPRGAINFALEKLRYRGLGLLADHALGAWWLPEFIDNRALAGIHDPNGYARRLARTLVGEARRGPTLFAFHATAAHFPGDPVHPHYRKFVDRSLPLERRVRMHFSPIAPGTPAPGDGWGREASEALYDELLSQADAQLGVVLDALKEHGLYDQALIVVFSDHGESFHADVPALAGATPVHGGRLSEEENRILLAVKLPKGLQAEVGAGSTPLDATGWRSGRAESRPPEKVDALVRLIDVGPTLLELVGLPPLPEADGVSLVPLLRGEPFPAQRLYAETGFTHAAPDAFDPRHASLAPRSFEAYRVRADGVVEMSPDVHEAIVREKDLGAFDGESWVIRAPQKDGTMAERCVGPCDDPGLSAWLDELLARFPSKRSPDG